MDANYNTGNAWMPNRTNGLAIASLIISIASFCTFPGYYCGIPIILSIAAIIMAFVARSQIKKAPQVYTGKGLTTATFVIAGIIIVINILLIFVVLIGLLVGACLEILQ